MSDNITDGLIGDDERREIIILKYGQAMELVELLTIFENREDDADSIQSLYRELDVLEAQHTREFIDLKKQLSLTK